MQSGEGPASFVARIWLERRQNGGPVRRDHIQYVQSGDERYFCKLTKMCAFLERLTDVKCDGIWDEKPEDNELPR